MELSNILQNINKEQTYFVQYFYDGYTKEISDKIKLELENDIIIIDGTKINLDAILDIKMQK